MKWLYESPAGRTLVLLAIIVPVALILMPSELRSTLALKATWLMGQYLPALAVGSAIGWLAYSKSVWAKATVICAALTLMLQIYTYAPH